MSTRPSIAIVGSGIAGLGAAWRLSEHADVTIYEAEDWIGGHTNTRDVQTASGPLAVDTGFIVHNHSTYPELVAMFRELGVETRKSEMSMSVTCAGCGLQYAGRRPLSLILAALRRPANAKLLLEIRRFTLRAATDLDAGIDPNWTLDQYLHEHGYSERLRGHFLIPLTAAVWSMPPGEALGMPAAYILAFLRNHGMIGSAKRRTRMRSDRVEWYTVSGGSREYVRRMGDVLNDNGVLIVPSTPIARIERDGAGVTLHTASGDRVRHDWVVIGAHADQALDMLDEPTSLEQDLLGVWRFTTNDTVLHTDASLLPKRRAARASWNYHVPGCHAASGPPTLTYSMNRLQGFAASEQWCVTLNGADRIDPRSIQYRVAYTHPYFDRAAVRTQARLPELAEQTAETRTVFCGAWFGYGFHEDGLASGLRAAEALLPILTAPPLPREPLTIPVARDSAADDSDTIEDIVAAIQGA